MKYLFSYGREELLGCLERLGVKIVYFFGSQAKMAQSFLEGQEFPLPKRSDLDIGIVFGRESLDGKRIFDELFIPLSLFFEPFEVDLVILDEKDPLFQYEAIKQGLIFFEADPEYTEGYEELTMKKAADLLYKQKAFEKDFLEAIKNGYFEIELQEN